MIKKYTLKMALKAGILYQEHKITPDQINAIQEPARLAVAVRLGAPGCA